VFALPLVSETLRQLETRCDDLSRIIPLTEKILSRLMCTSPPPTAPQTLANLLRCYQQLEQRGEGEVAEQVRQQVEAGIRSLLDWLAVADLGISPYLLRTHLEQNPLEAETQKALLRYLLSKSPHAESDRDKLDYLLSSYFSQVKGTELAARFENPDEQQRELLRLYPKPVTSALDPAAETMLHDLESLTARVGDFEEFEQLVGARMVERARALKSNLGDDFYHPRTLAVILRFNLTFRRHFEQLFRRQIEQSKAQTAALIAASRQIYAAIESAFSTLPVPSEPPSAAATAPSVAAPEERVGRPPTALHERLPIDSLVHRPQDPQKETELRGIIRRIARHFQAVAPGWAVLPSRNTSVVLYDWEREAFSAGIDEKAPLGARTVQVSVGLIVWMEEEYVLYQQNRGDRYQWKPHMDMLNYAVERAHEELQTIHGLLELGGPEEEAVWFPALVNTAKRLLTVMEKIAPVFA